MIQSLFFVLSTVVLFCHGDQCVTGTACDNVRGALTINGVKYCCQGCTTSCTPNIRSNRTFTDCSCPQSGTGTHQCSSGAMCDAGKSCEVGGVNYCCPGAYMQLRHSSGQVSSCSCQNSGVTGYSCTSSGNPVSVTSAFWLTYTLTTMVATCLMTIFA